MNIRVHASFAAYLSAILLLDGAASAGCLLLSLLAHEAGHIAAGRLFQESYEQIELTPFGGVLRRKNGTGAKGVRAALIAACGPACNYLLILVVSPLAKRGCLSAGTAEKMLLINLSMLLINLLPALPLDGGRILFSLGEIFFSIEKMAKALSLCGMLFGVFFVLLALGGFMLVGTLNITLLFCGAALFCSALSQPRILLLENRCAFLMQREGGEAQLLPVSVYSVDEHTSPMSLFPALCQSQRCVFLVSSSKGTQIVSESDVIDAMMNAPQAAILDSLQKKEDFRETFP